MRGARVSVEDKLKEILSQELDIEISKITPDLRFIEDLGADSIAIVEIVLACEEQFDVNIADEDVEKLLTVGAAIDYAKARWERKSE